MSEKTSDQRSDEESQEKAEAKAADQAETDQKQAVQATADAEQKTGENASAELLHRSGEEAATQTNKKSEEDASSEEDVSMAAFKVVIEQDNAEDPDDGKEEGPLLETDDQRVLVPGGYPVLSLKHVDYTRKVQGRPEQILDDVDLEFQRRRIYSVETTSPSGRAALMALITGLRAPTQGSVLFRGTDLRQLLASDYRGHQIGAIFGTDALRRDLTAVQNLVYTMDASGRTFLGPKDNLARHLLDEVGFPEHLQDRLTADLSHLDFRLASVARALCCECDVLVADEPTEGLEPGDWDTLLATLKRVSRRHDCTVIILTSGGSDTVDEGTYDDRFIVD
ncbi:ATP-binding cassette domain-containing protein [Bifidobacterium sp. B4001]|uniref:ATP-binding cassette domain-containing protein n=1 Tax=unclassified Bifidobacterium TaxID=2608897 RepID=UPI00226B9977|nr:MULTISPECIES: ATP-binding cassette domain-containing protein [unclassified Bifidobacterium]MCX8673329.1 ATP-binding cassette domain-containing protein [Bifidobacterium sp. B4079]MCX8681762.1 ATP-binding cassette domain-containing protein [Bifidobacterium sp. B4001]